MKADEMELSLDLSIGGCYKNVEKSRNHENEKTHEIDDNNTSSRSVVSENYGVGCVQGESFSSESADQFKKREIQALRRREAMKKREEKQKRWARSRGTNERFYLEMHQNQARAMDRGMKENQNSEDFLFKKGSSSTDTGSHSNYSQGGQQQLSATANSNTSEKSDMNGPSSLMRFDQVTEKATDLLTMSSSNIHSPHRSNTQKCEPINKPMRPTPQEQLASASRQCNEAMLKSSSPQSNKQDTTPLPKMPLVSTTGNGPNGITVNGFLYSCSKSEVSIVCVCHGSSFSPAKFVEHAGGINISHPLRHITIVPTPFG